MVKLVTTILGNKKRYNRNWSEEQGGILMFFDNSDELNITDALVPLNCSIQAFKISKISLSFPSIFFSF